ncbi:MAG TPA: hypothetical protein VG317_00220 [Pseudonocardiaceae bacterium]|nr:hypothetical protein [Pseudonocardiaceae bacterium]
MTAPANTKDGRAVLTGAGLAEQCAIYQQQGTGWAGEGIQGLGVVGFENANNVDSRIASFVLAYADDSDAETVWVKMTDATRTQLPQAKQQNSAVGDQNSSFVTDAGTVVVLRTGSVVAPAMSHSDMGYQGAADPYGDTTNPDETDPIQMWSTVQARKINAVLGGA